MKYNIKYTIGGAGFQDSDEDEILRQTLEESKKPFDEDELSRQTLEESKKTLDEAERSRQILEERNEVFQTRIVQAKILVIGADTENTSDIYRWSQIDPNYIGVSFMGNDPISDLGDWNHDIDYWTKVFNILDNRQFDSIYIDRGTIIHMLGLDLPLHSFSEKAIARFIRFIHEKNITDKLYIYDDHLLSTVNIQPEEYDFNSYPHRNDLGHAIALENIYDNETEHIQQRGKLSRYLLKYFRCCDMPTKINLPPNEDGKVIDELFVSWTKRLDENNPIW